MNKAMTHINQGLSIISAAFGQMQEERDPSDQVKINMAPPGFVPVTNADLVNDNIADRYAADMEEMRELAIDRYTGAITPDQSARLNELLETYDGQTGGIQLLLSGNYAGHFFQQGLNLDLDTAEAGADAYNDGNNHLVIQSVFDPVVADKPTTIDEYSVVVNMPVRMDPNDFLMQMAGDMDGTLGNEFYEAGDFVNQGDTPEVGQVIEIDVKDVPAWWASVPFLDDESPVNAPVMITDIGDNYFTVQTLELNGNEHPLHGTRQWGFEEMEDGTVRFYTRGVSVEDSFGAEQGARGGEWNMWNIWVDGVEGTITDAGGSVVPDTRINNQSTGPSGSELWDNLSPSQQGTIQHEQISGLEREIETLKEDNPRWNHPRSQAHHRIDQLQGEIDAWEEVKVGS